MLAVRPSWREAAAIVVTALLVLTVPLGAWAVAQTGEQLARVERAAAALEDAGPKAAEIATTLADVTRQLVVLAEEHRPALTAVSDGVVGVTSELQDLTDQLRPLSSTLGAVAAALDGNGVGDALAEVQGALDTVTSTVDGVATTTADVAAQVELLTSPETLAVVSSATTAVEALADLSDRAGDLAAGYVDHASAIATAARVLAVVSLLASVALVVWRFRQHRRWQHLRRDGTGTRVLAVCGA